MSEHPIEAVGSHCVSCRMEVSLFDFHSMAPYTGCTEYCYRVSDSEIAEWHAAKVGDYCIWPCDECGEPTEGEWDREALHTSPTVLTFDSFKERLDSVLGVGKR